MRKRLKFRGKGPGFTIVEILILLGIISLLAVNIVLPQYFRNMERARADLCAENRRVAEQAEMNYFMDTQEHSAVLQDLVDKGYLKVLPVCPAGGIYAWEDAPEGSPEYQTVLICSVHGMPDEPMTSIGTNVGEIANNFIQLLSDYYSAHGEYPSGGTKKVLQSIGLDPGEWSQAVEGIRYVPKGDTLQLIPDKESTMYVKDAQGNEITVTRLVYSLEGGTWYAEKEKEGNEADLGTLRVE